MEEYVATGRRKTAVASVRLRHGSGKVDINGKERLEEYFAGSFQVQNATSSLAKAGLTGRFDMIVRVKGGGLEAQAEAMRLGLARALVEFNPELKPVLKEDGLLTRDSRRRERKKYGQPGARKRFQFSKR
jgi:small subunit ribosomal protein S9